MSVVRDPMHDAAKQLEFSHVSTQTSAWREVLHLGTRLKYPKGTEVMSSGHIGEFLYFLDKGEVRLVRVTLDGREKLLWSIEENSLFGETPFFDGIPSKSATVCAKDSVVYAFSRSCVLQTIFPQYPHLVQALLCSMASKVRVLSNQSVSLSMEELPSRICTYLHLRLGDDYRTASDPCVCPGLNQQELANLLGVHRVTLNKALRELERESVLSPYSRDGVYVLDMEKFRALVLQ